MGLKARKKHKGRRKGAPEGTTDRARAVAPPAPAPVTVDDYVAGCSDAVAPVLERLRAIVRESAPSLRESLRWGMPHYAAAGPVLFLDARDGYVNVGFFRGAELSDPEGLLRGDGKLLRHLSVAEAPASRDPIAALVREAAALGGWRPEL